jgi:hypothetical protein
MNTTLAHAVWSHATCGRALLAFAAVSAVAAAGSCKSDPKPLPSPSPSSSAVDPAQAGDPTLPEELQQAEAAGPEDAAAPDAPWEGPWFVVTKAAAAVYAEPKFDAKLKLGYVRSGGRVPVKDRPVSQHNCKAGWYQAVSGGYICGSLGTTDANHPLLKFTTRQPVLEQVLPYTYARNAKHGTPLYRSVPSREQMYAYEPYLPGARAEQRRQDGAARSEDDAAAARPAPPSSSRAASAEAGVTAARADVGAAASDPMGAALADAGVLALESDAGDAPESPWWQKEDPDDELHELKLDDLATDADDILVKRMVKGFYIAIDRTFRWNDRTWYKTTKGLVAPADRFWQVAGSKFRGVELDGSKYRLPIAWVYGGRKTAPTYELDADSGALKPARAIERFEAIQLTGEQQTVHGTKYWETQNGTFIKDAHVRVTRPGDAPTDLGPNERWLDVNLTEQTLVAFEGTRAVYATLVSTGKKSTIKEKDHRTPSGQWRIREKHVATTMDGDGTAAGDLPYSIEDVPYVMYFHRSYAIHGAFWHRNYGVMMSHGCINLAPLDAKHLFFFTEPTLPEGWHGVWASEQRPGSRVVVHD